MLYHNLLPTILRLFYVFGSLLVVPAMSNTLSMAVGPNAIISLANAPSIIEVSGTVDDAGRPSLNLRLSFANDCLLKTGPDIRFAGTGKGDAIIFVLQTVPPDGCPDIFQPVTADYQVLLPSKFAGGKARILARPLSGPKLQEVELGSGKKSVIATVIEAKPYEVSVFLPDITQITVNNLAVGYELSISVMLAPHCRPEQMTAVVYEVPNEAGTPASDVVVVTAPQTCRDDTIALPMMITIATPQPSAHRQVIIVNDASNAAVPIAW